MSSKPGTWKGLSLWGAGFLVMSLVLMLVVLTSLRNSNESEAQPGPALHAAIIPAVPSAQPPIPSAQPSHTQGPRIVSTPEVLRGRDMGAWSYVVSRGSDGTGTYVAAAVRYDTSSVSSLQAYAAANRVLAGQLAITEGEVEVLVTFRSYVLPDQFRAWVARKGLTVQTTGLRILDASGRRTGLGVSARQNDVLPESDLGWPGDPDTEGVIETRGTIPTNRLLDLATDPLVFIPDVTPAVIRQEMSGIVSDPGEISVSVGGAFWAMEDFGLQNFR